MSLQFVLGNSGSGKSHYLYQHVISESINNPKNNYLVIVPEQFTMETQRKLCDLHPRGGIMNIDILSFGRLAHRVFEETGANTKLILDDEGKNLIIRKVVEKQKRNLPFLGYNVLKSGYIAEIKSVISEFTQYGIGVKELEEFLENSNPKSRMYLKLKDIKDVYESFEEYLADKYITKDEVLDVLSQAVPESKMLKNSTIVLDGFTGFTPIQNRLIGELLKVCPKIIISVTIDEKENPYVYNTPMQLFGLSKKLVTTLIKVAKGCEVAVDEPIELFTKPLPRYIPRVSKGDIASINIADKTKEEIARDIRFDINNKAGDIKFNKELSFLEKNIFRNSKEIYSNSVNDIFLNIIRSPKEEAEFVASKIIELVRTRDYRFQDIAVIVSDMNVYGPQFIHTFESFDIPHFIDYKRSIMLNSFVDYLRSLLDMVSEGFSYDSVFRFMRSGLFSFEQDDMDALDNYLQATGIRGFNKWRSPWIYETREAKAKELEKLNSLRVAFVELMEPLVFVLSRRSKTVEDITLALYEFLVGQKMQELLVAIEGNLQDEGELALSKEYSQVYGVVMELFDKLVSLLGEERVSLSEYMDILDSGLEEVKIGAIPPALDQVTMGDIQRTRINEAKVLFLVGANDSFIPGNPGKRGLLSEDEREQIKENDLPLSPGIKEQIFIQKFYLYLILSKPSESLYISLAKTNIKGESLRHSYLVSEIRKLFPLIKIEDVDSLPIHSREVTSKMALKILSKGLSSRNYGLDNTWKELYTSYQNAKNTDVDKLKSIINGSFYKNAKTNINDVELLYGDRDKVSVTRLERFAGCPFQHFLTYGLKVKERETYEFEAIDLGIIAHEAMERFSKMAREVSDSWSEISLEDKATLVEASVDYSVGNYGNHILFSNKRYEYMISRIKKLIYRSVWALTAQMEKSDFRPLEFEMNFGAGKIDRVDTCEIDEKIYVKVTDYKTGSKSFDITSFYHGLQLQLPVYLNAAIELQKKENPKKEVIPAGFLYYQMQDPLVEKKSDETLVDVELLKKLKPEGLVNGEPEVLERFEDGYTNKSILTPGTTKQISQNQFQTLLKYANTKVDSLKDEIYQGEVNANPFKFEKATGCDYCDFKAICRFDPTIEGFRYNNIKKIGKEEAFFTMEEKIGE